MTSIVCDHGLVNDNDDADDLFPAYTAYIHGVDTQREESINFDALLYANSTRPIYYTNSMPSRSRPYDPSRNAPQLHPAPEQWITNLGLESSSNLADGSSVLDLRLPSLYPDVVRLVPPQCVHLLPPSFSFHGLAPPMATAPVSSAEMTRRKLLNASQRPNILAPPSQTSSQQVLYSLRQQDRSGSYPDQCHVPARQATHPSLLRSSSATDVDSQLGRRPLSRPLTPLPLVPPTLSVGQLSLPLARSQQGPLPSHPTAALNLPSSFIRPGELLANPCYAAIPKPYRQQMDAQFIQLWSAAQQHLDHEAKNKALKQIRTSTAYVYEVLRKMEQLAQRPAQVNTQSSISQSQHTERRYAHPSALPNEQEHKVQSSQSQQQTPSQQLEHQSPSSQYPQDTQWVQTNQAYHVSHVPRFPPLTQTPPPILANLRAHIDAQIPIFLATASKSTSMEEPLLSHSSP
jgi:hypothetical protein